MESLNIVTLAEQWRAALLRLGHRLVGQGYVSAEEFLRGAGYLNDDVGILMLGWSLVVLPHVSALRETQGVLTDVMNTTDGCLCGGTDSFCRDCVPVIEDAMNIVRDDFNRCGLLQFFPPSVIDVMLTPQGLETTFDIYTFVVNFSDVVELWNEEV
jgi:hypothetical protein